MIYHQQACKQTFHKGAGQMAQQLTAKAVANTALAEDPGSFPSTPTGGAQLSVSPVPGDPMLCSRLNGHEAHTSCTEIYACKTHRRTHACTFKNKNYLKSFPPNLHYFQDI